MTIHEADTRYLDGHDDVDLAQLARLRTLAGWGDSRSGALAEQVRGARWVVSAWDGPRLIGFARAISDGVTNAYVASLVVDPAYRRRGIGKAIIERLLTGRDEIRWVLRADPALAPFYAKLGFEPAPDMFRRERRPAGSSA